MAQTPPIKGILETSYRTPIFVVNIPVTGNCNFNCSFCAYTHHTETFEDFPISLYHEVLEQLPLLKQVVDCPIYFNFTGGEPTLNLPLLQEFVDLVAPYKDEQLKVTLASNGSYGASEDAIKQILAMQFDHVQITFSEYHLQFQKMEDLLRIGKAGGVLLKAVCVDERPDSTKTQELYADIIPYIPLIEWIRVGIREYDFQKNLPIFLPGSNTAIRRCRPEGVYCYPDGTLGPVCIGEGNQYSCQLGTVRNIAEIAPKIMEAYLEYHIKLKSYSGNVGALFTPACALAKRLDINYTCFDKKILDVTMQDKKLVVSER